MKVTVCQLRNQIPDFDKDWDNLVRHVQTEQSELVLLPEMTFFPWFAWASQVDATVWQQAIKAHEAWHQRLHELAPALVCGSSPVNEEGKRFNRAFVWDPKTGFNPVHDKYHLPDEEGFWENSWYDRGDGDFTPYTAAHVKIGFAICSEIWFFQHARVYGQQGIHLILCPRATPRETLDKWVVAGQAAAVVSGAFCLSSNRISSTHEEANLGGQGWIAGPDGELLGLTSQAQPILSLEVNLELADLAKQTYPRYIPD